MTIIATARENHVIAYCRWLLGSAETGDAALRPAAGIGGRVGVDIERRDVDGACRLLPSPADRPRTSNSDRGGCRAGTSSAGQRAAAAAARRSAPVPVGSPAIRFDAVLQLGGNEAAIDEDDAPAGLRAAASGSDSRSRRPPRSRRERFPCRSEKRLSGDMTEFHAARCGRRRAGYSDRAARRPPRRARRSAPPSSAAAGSATSRARGTAARSERRQRSARTAGETRSSPAREPSIRGGDAPSR